MRLSIIGFEPPRFLSEDNPITFLPSQFYRIVNFNYVYAINVWVLLFPEWLCFDWSMGCVHLITSMNDFRILVIAILWLSMFLLLWSTVKENRDAKNVVSFSLALCVVPFLPASNVVVNVGFVIAERNLYIPSMGFCLLVCFGFQKVTSFMQKSNTKMVNQINR